jgi:hypothetical protein
VRGDTHAGCGERSGETGPWQHRHRAPDRLNSRAGLRPGSVVRPATATIRLKVTPKVSGLSALRRLLTNTVGQARAAVPTHS